MSRERVFISLQKRGVLRLPASLRQRYNLDSPGAQVEVVARPDGVIELHPHTAVPADQAWFWSERWQRMEREAEADLEAGRLTRLEGDEELLSALEARMRPVRPSHDVG